jgi:hypothetical protein
MRNGSESVSRSSVRTMAAATDASTMAERPSVIRVWGADASKVTAAWPVSGITGAPEGLVMPASSGG